MPMKKKPASLPTTIMMSPAIAPVSPWAADFYSLQKRVLDLLSASALLILFLPVWLVVPILIKFDSPGPVIYRHRRIGKNGQTFYILKFRSMVDGAHEYLHQKNPKLLKQFKAGDWKLKDDPRITRLGKILRSITVDEFPQLINVLRGEMSLVGPRAYMQEEINDQIKNIPKPKL
jgi:lipopolysaccharide/colanic/teichoic acid biosynthesis glycosyltransferase